MRRCPRPKAVSDFVILSQLGTRAEWGWWGNRPGPGLGLQGPWTRSAAPATAGRAGAGGGRSAQGWEE